MTRRLLLSLTLALAATLAAPPVSAQFAPGGDQVQPSTTNAPANAAAQSANRIPPPTPPATESLGMTTLLYYAVIVILGGATIAVSIMPGKRSHQD